MADHRIPINKGAEQPPGEPAHYTFGASKAAQWLNCPGSIQAQEGYPNATTAAADEGTAAHWLVEQCFLSGQECQEWVDAQGLVEIPANESTGCQQEWPITGEMIEAVQLMLDTVRKDADKKGSILWVEDRVRLDQALGLPVPVGGTSDARVYLPRSKVLKNYDFKYGKGHAVEVFQAGKQGRGLNEQLGNYALGALYEFQREFPDREVKWVELVVVQPRGRHKKGPVRSYKASLGELGALEMDIIVAVPAALDADPPRYPDENHQCLFCRAKHDCPERRAALGEAVADEWQAYTEGEKSASPVPAPTDAYAECSTNDRGEVVIPPGRNGGQEVVLPNLVPPSAMTADQLGIVRRALPSYKEWIKAFEAEVKRRLEHGIPVPGARLGAGPGSRPWVDAAKVMALAGECCAEGLARPGDICEPVRLKSVPQVEKALGKKRFKELGFAEHVTHLAGGAVVVDAESDKRDYVKPGGGFEAETPVEPAPADIDGEDLI